MSFKSFECYIDGYNATPQDWDTTGWVIQVVTETDLGQQFKCDPATSNFIGALPVSSGMDQADFNTLWPALTLVMVIAYCVKRVRWAMLNY